MTESRPWKPALILLATLTACDAAAECEADVADRSEVAAAAAPVAPAPAATPAAEVSSSAPEVAEAAAEPPIAPEVRASFKGTLDPDLIRRIVRAHIPEVRHCYNEGLGRDPELAGRVAIAFTIAETGNVEASKIQESSLADDEVSACIQAAVTRWIFPRPDGGAVEVVYPFVLEPG